MSEAEDAMGITVESYIGDSPGGAINLPDETDQFTVSPALLGKKKCLSPNQIAVVVLEGLASFGNGGNSLVIGVSGVMVMLFEKQEYVDVIAILDNLYTSG